MEKVRKLIDVDAKSLQILEAEAKKQKRSLKSYLEHTLQETAKKLESPSEEYKLMMDEMLTRVAEGKVEYIDIKEIKRKNMGFKVRMLREAAVELHVAECYFASKSLSREFLNDFARQLQFLKTTPCSFQVKYKGIRALNFEQFNYSIHYKVDKEEVMIYRILNQKTEFLKT